MCPRTNIIIKVHFLIAEKLSGNMKISRNCIRKSLTQISEGTTVPVDPRSKSALLYTWGDIERIKSKAGDSLNDCGTGKLSMLSLGTATGQSRPNVLSLWLGPAVLPKAFPKALFISCYSHHCLRSLVCGLHHPCDGNRWCPGAACDLGEP